MRYKLADGSFIEAPADLTAEESAWLKQNGGVAEVVAAPKKKDSTLVDMLKSGASGLYEGAVRAPFILGDLSTMGMNLVDKKLRGLPGNRETQSDKFLRLNVENFGGNVALRAPETTAGRYANAVGNAVGGSVLGGAGAVRLPPLLGAASSGAGRLIRASMQSPVTLNVGIGAGAELAGDAGRGFDETKEQNPLIKMAGGLAVGGGGAAVARARAPKFDQEVYRGTKDLTPQQWAQAQALEKRMAAAGSESVTIPDTLPSTNTLRSAAQEISNAPGGEALYRKLAGRDEGDIAQLLSGAKRDAQQAAVPNVSALQAGQQGDEFVAQTAAGNRTGAMMPILQNAPMLPQSKLRDIATALENKSRMPQNAGTEDARYLGQASRTLDAMPVYEIPPAAGVYGPGLPGVNQQALSKVVKGLETVDSQVGGPAGQVLKNQAAVGASKDASRMLRQESPEYAQAMQTYADNTPQVELTRLLAENKLYARPNPTSSSQSSDAVREQIAAAMAKIDSAAGARVGEKLMAADQLAKLRPQQGMQSMEQQYGNTMLGTLMTPFSSVARASNRGMRLSTNTQLAELLANPTGVNYQTLVEMAKVDPAIAKMMTNIGNVGAVNSVSQTQGSEP